MGSSNEVDSNDPEEISDFSNLKFKILKAKNFHLNFTSRHERSSSGELFEWTYSKGNL